MTKQAKKTTYAILSGEGERGTWALKQATGRGIKRILTNERCGGDRWAKAFYKPQGVSDVGIDVETGEARGMVFCGERRYWEV